MLQTPTIPLLPLPINVLWYMMQIGNAVINDETDTKGMYDYLATHALISDEIANQVHKYCDFSPNSTTETKECDDAMDAIDRATYYIDIYNIYAPLCTSSNLTVKPKKASVSSNIPIQVKTKLPINSTGYFSTVLLCGTDTEI